MTVAPSHPPVHSHDPGKNPMELVSTSAGRMERWRADALLLGETSAAIQARHDAVTTLDNIEQQKRELAAGQAALTIERATFDAERRAFADQAAALAGRLSVEWDRMQKIKLISSANRKSLSTSCHKNGAAKNGSHRWHWKTLARRAAIHPKPLRRKIKTQAASFCGRFLNSVCL
jgi:hypothetical protein